MEVTRDLIRDLVGILFPGGLFVIFTIWSIWAIMLPFNSLASLIVLPTDKSVVVLLIISYVAGQSLRMKQLVDLEKRCTDEYRKRKSSKMNVDENKWKDSVAKIDEAERDYFEGKLNIEGLKNLYRQYSDDFGLWEEFPYGYLLASRRLLRKSQDYVSFFEKYEKQGIAKTETFFNSCKSVIYEYSPSFKEEVLRQESLVRLFAGLYYVIKYGKVAAIGVCVLHSLLIAGRYLKVKPDFSYYQTIGLSYMIILASILAFAAFIYMNREIIKRLRYMRVKELNLAHDGFYLICKKHNLDL